MDMTDMTRAAVSRRHFLQLAGAGMLALTGTALTGCGNSTSGEGSDKGSKLAAIKSRGHLNAGVKKDVPGYGYYDTAKGRFEGMEVDLCYQIAAAVFGVSYKEARAQELVEFTDVTPKTRGPLIDNGQLDVVAATYTITDERKKSWDFSTPYRTDYVGLMVNQTFYDLGTAPSVIRRLFAYGLEQAKIVGKENVFDYSLGNPSIPAPKKVNESIHKLVDETDSIQLHGYSMAPGFEEPRAAIAADLSRRFGLDIRSSELFLTCGAAPALISVIKALVVDGDSEIMVIAPFFPEYAPFITANGGKMVVVPADTNAFQVQLDEVEQRITPHTQAIIVNSPNNPSGVVYTEETLRDLASLLERKSVQYGHPIYIIADEPYRELVYGGVKVPFIPCLYKNTIVCYSYSKSLSLPGERIGYVYVPSFAEDSTAVYATVSGAARAMGHVCPPTLIQKVVGLCAQEQPDLQAYDENRTLLYDSLRAMGYECAKPDGAFYLFVKAPGGDAGAFSEKAKREHNLLVVPADGFGCPGYFRLSYCVSNEMIRRSLPAFRAMMEAYQ